MWALGLQCAQTEGGWSRAEHPSVVSRSASATWAGRLSLSTGKWVVWGQRCGRKIATEAWIQKEFSR